MRRMGHRIDEGAWRPPRLEIDMATREFIKLMSRARKGEAQAQLELGRLYLSGCKGVRPNSSAALNWFVEAWETGCHEAAHEIARIEAIGVFPEDLRKSYMAACDHAATAGSPAANFALAEIHAGMGYTETARRYYRTAATTGHPRAALRLGCLILDDPSADENAEAARNWLEVAAEAGEMGAIKELAEILVRDEDPAAIPWLRILARDNDTVAMAELARLLLERSSEEAWLEARDLLTQAARKGNPLAMWLWGRMHVRQLRDPKLKKICVHSPRKAIALLERAAGMGVAEAHWDLARIHALPKTPNADSRAFRRHLEAAANAGIPAAQLKLARRLMLRRDSPEAWLRAGEYLVAACNHGSSRNLAERFLDEIADRAPAWPSEVLRAQAHLLPVIREHSPSLAARLNLAATLGLTTREALFVDLDGADCGSFFLADVRKHFVYNPWRLIHVTTQSQREALGDAMELARDVSDRKAEVLIRATTRARARQLDAFLTRRLQIDPAIFIHDWRPPD